MARSSGQKRHAREQRRRERERARQVESRVVSDDPHPTPTDPQSPESSGSADALRGESGGDAAARATGGSEVDSHASLPSGEAGGAADPPQTSLEPAGNRPEAYVRPGLMERLFGGGERVEAPGGLVRFERKPGLFRPLARREFAEQQREAALLSIREGFGNLSDLMADIRDGLDDSVQKQGELLEQLKYLPVVAEQNRIANERFEEANRLQGESLKMQGESLKVQTQALGRINDQLRSSASQQAAQSEAINRVLGGMNRESRDQKRDLDELQARLERMRASDQSIADNLSTVGHAVRKVAEQGNVHSEFLAKMQTAMDARTAQLEQTVRQQQSRTGLLLTVALILTALALAGVAVIGFLYLRSQGAI